MARILRWKEKLVLACFTLLCWIPRAWALRLRDAASQHRPGYSLLVTGTNQKTAFGVELMARRPYLRLTRASRVPVQMPLAAGAYLAMASPAAAVNWYSTWVSIPCGSVVNQGMVLVRPTPCFAFYTSLGPGRANVLTFYISGFEAVQNCRYEFDDIHAACANYSGV